MAIAIDRSSCAATRPLLILKPADVQWRRERRPQELPGRLRTPFASSACAPTASMIAEIVYLPRSARALAPGDPLAERACAQIERYVDDPDFRFDLPLAESAPLSSVASGQRSPRSKRATPGPTASWPRAALRPARRRPGRAEPTPYPWLVPATGAPASGIGASRTAKAGSPGLKRLAARATRGRRPRDERAPTRPCSTNSVTPFGSKTAGEKHARVVPVRSACSEMARATRRGSLSVGDRSRSGRVLAARSTRRGAGKKHGIRSSTQRAALEPEALLPVSRACSSNRIDPTLKLDPPKKARGFPKCFRGGRGSLLAEGDAETPPLGLRDRAMLEVPLRKRAAGSRSWCRLSSPR